MDKCEARPRVAVENAMKGREAWMFGQAEGAQAVGDCARAGRHQGTDCEGRGGVATALAEGGEEGCHPSNEALWKMQIGANHNRSPATVRRLQVNRVELGKIVKTSTDPVIERTAAYP